MTQLTQLLRSASAYSRPAEKEKDKVIRGSSTSTNVSSTSFAVIQGGGGNQTEQR